MHRLYERRADFFLFSFRKILKFRRNKGFEQRMLLSTETIICCPQCFFSSWGLLNVRKVRNAPVSAVSRAGNLDDEYEQARVFNMATAIGHYQWNFHVNRSVFCDSKCFRVFQTLLIKLASICIGVLFPVHVCSVHIQAIFLVLTEIYYPVLEALTEVSLSVRSNRRHRSK